MPNERVSFVAGALHVSTRRSHLRQLGVAIVVSTPLSRTVDYSWLVVELTVYFGPSSLTLQHFCRCDSCDSVGTVETGPSVDSRGRDRILLSMVAAAGLTIADSTLSISLCR